jgi:hypothetical protein
MQENRDQMTDRERKLHIAGVRIDVEEAEDQLAVLQDQASSLAEKIAYNATIEPSASDFTADGDAERRLTPDQATRFGAANAIATLIEDLKKARQAVRHNRERKRKLERTSIATD